jgi:hypothetical protein
MKILLNILAVLVALIAALYAPYGAAAIQEALQPQVEDDLAGLEFCSKADIEAFIETFSENLKISGVIFVIELIVIVLINRALKRRRASVAISLPADASFDDSDDSTQYD